MSNYDLIVLGSGPGGYVAAIRAAQLGLKAAIIEKEILGGICLNWGCIPTKALLKASELNYTLSKLDDFGINVIKPKYNWSKIVSRTRKVASKLSTGVGHLLKKNKIDIIYGMGSIAGQGRVIVNNNKKNVLHEAPNIIIATGARARTIPGIKYNEHFWSYKEAMISDKKPEKLLIIGAGAIGVEFASFYNDFGSDVTLIEMQKNILPSEDLEISDLAKTYFEKSGIKVFVSTKAQDFKSNGNGVSCLLKNSGSIKKKHTFNKVIMAVGIEANVEDIGLENINLELDKGRIITDSCGATSEQGIYAIGDVTGPPWLAHKASHEGIRCVERIFDPNSTTNHRIIVPSCIYSRPQIASIGLTENGALEKGYKTKVGKFPLVGNGKSIAMGSSDGIVKTIFNKENGELLGAHMIGAEVTELISNYSIAMQLEATEDDLFNVIFPHPTVSESIYESVLNAFDRGLHI